MQLHHVLTQLLMILALLPMTIVPAAEYELRTIATGLDKPWSIAEIDENAFLVTEKGGRLIKLFKDGSITAIKGAPEVYFASQGGLLEVLPDPAFSKNQTV